MTATKTNERPGTRATLRHCRMSAYKAREVLDLIRGEEFVRATEILDFSDREAAFVIGKILRSAGANALHNDGVDPEETFVSACYADEGTTIKRFKPRARGRASRIRKRTCHITVILTRLPEDQVARRRARIAAEQAERRARRVAGGRRRRGAASGAETTESSQAAEEKASTEVLDALDEARALEETTHRAQLEAQAGSVLDHEGHDQADHTDQHGHDGHEDEDEAMQVEGFEAGDEVDEEGDEVSETESLPEGEEN